MTREAPPGRPACDDRLVTLLLTLLIMAVVAVVAAVAAGRIAGGLDAPASSLPGRGLPDGPVEAATLDRVRFSPALRGYRMDEVDDVLDRVTDELRRRDEELARLRDEAARLRAHLLGHGAVTPAPTPAPTPGPAPTPAPTPAPAPGPGQHGTDYHPGNAQPPRASVPDDGGDA